MFSLNLHDKFEARVANHLEYDQVVWLTTVDPSGVPQPLPVWFVWDGQTLLFYSKPNQAKLRNMATSPRVSLNFNGDRNGGDIVVLHGTAAVDPAAPPAIANPAFLAKYRTGIVDIDMTPESYTAEYTVAVRVAPERLRGF